MQTMLRTIACIVMISVAVGWAYAEFSEPEDAIAYRKSVMVLVARHFQNIAAVVQGKADHDKGAFARNAEVLQLLATLPWQAAMTPGSDQGDTTLSPAVFENREAFMKAARMFEDDTAKLARLASAGDLAGSKEQFVVVAGNCKRCHDRFRNK